FGIFDYVTPQAALAAFAVAGIADCAPMKTGFQVLNLLLAGCLISFIYVFVPSMLLIDIEGLMTNARDYPLSSLWDTAVVVISTILGLIALAAGLEGFFKTHVNVISRVILIISAIMLVIP